MTKVSNKFSLTRLSAIIRKEFWHIVRDWQTLGVVIGMPVLMMFLYGYALNSDVKEVPVIVEDASQSTESRALIEKIDGSSLFKVTRIVSVTSDPTEYFRLSPIHALFRIPPDFNRDLRRHGNGAHIQVLIDGSDPNVGTIIRNASEPLLLNATLQLLQIERPKVLDIRSRVLYNPEQKSAFFFVPGLMAVILLMISALLTSIAITKEKELGTMGQLLVSPLQPLEIIVGKIIPYMLLAAIDGLLILTVGRFVFGVSIVGNSLLLAVASLVYIFTALSIGLFISTIAKKQQHAMMMALGATMLPTVILSGFIFPTSSMPLPLQGISQIIPATHFLKIVRGIILKGVGLRELWQPLSILCLEGFVLMFVSIKKFRLKL